MVDDHAARNDLAETGEEAGQALGGPLGPTRDQHVVVAVQTGADLQCVADPLGSERVVLVVGVSQQLHVLGHDEVFPLRWRVVDRRTVQIAATAWAMVGFAIALASLTAVNRDARVVVGVASVVFPLCAVSAGIAAARGNLRTAGVLLVLSVATPTYFVWPVNLFPLVAGVALVLAPRRTLAS